MALDDLTPGTPDWWLLRHGRRLRERADKLDFWWRYYSGDHPLPLGPSNATEAYRDFLKMARTNFVQMVVDATVARTNVMGVNGSDGQIDLEAWGWWQTNRMDSRQAQIYRVALSQSASYVSVNADPETGEPLIVGEHPREAITEENPETGRTASGAKFWYDAILGRGRANLYLSDRTIRYVTAPRSPGPLPLMGRSSWQVMDVLEHELGIVPLVPFYARHEMGEMPEADFAKVLTIQDRINVGVLDRMMAQRYAAFRQRWIKGIELAEIEDPLTGQAVAESPFRPDPASIWTASDPEVQFGEFSQTDLAGFLRAHEADVRSMLLLTRTPGYYYATDLVNLSADAINAMDGQHVAKVRELQAQWGESWEDVLRIAARIADDASDRDSIEVRWQDPRQFNPAVLADMAVKLQSAGYPLAVIAEMTGESPQRIQAITSASAGQALLNAALTTAATPAAPATPAAAPPETV